MGDAALPAYAVDMSRWPIVSARPTSAVHDMAALDLTYAAIAALLARKETFAVVFDLRGASSSAARRKRFGTWVGQHELAIRRHVVGMAVIAASTVEQGFVTAALWILTPPIPMRVFTQVGDAEAWLEQLLAATRVQARQGNDDDASGR